MKRIKEEIVEKSRRYWRSSTYTAFLTFLSSKIAGMNTLAEMHIGKKEDEDFIERFLIVDKGKYYNPCTGNYPRNTLEYFKTISQYRHRQKQKSQYPYSQAFERSSRGFYKFKNDYVRTTKQYALKSEKASLSHIAIWLYRITELNDAEELADIKKKFITEFKITKEELEVLFNDDAAESRQIFDVVVQPSSFLETKTISYLKTPIASDINEPGETIRVHCETYRILRDTEIARRIKSLHFYQYQICGETINLLNGERYAEAHHIKPLGDNGPDIPENILCVCPNHHVLLDYGSIELDMLKLRIRPNHEVGEQFVCYHNEKMLKTR